MLDEDDRDFKRTRKPVEETEDRHIAILNRDYHLSHKAKKRRIESEHESGPRIKLSKDDTSEDVKSEVKVKIKEEEGSRKKEDERKKDEDNSNKKEDEQSAEHDRIEKKTESSSGNYSLLICYSTVPGGLTFTALKKRTRLKYNEARNQTCSTKALN